jgi:hypothetical protein
MDDRNHTDRRQSLLIASVPGGVAVQRGRSRVVIEDHEADRVEAALRRRKTRARKGQKIHFARLWNRRGADDREAA